MPTDVLTSPSHSSATAAPDVLYLLSPSYSGSTLLTFMLATHPEIATIGELKASSMGDIAAYHCSCGALLTQCSFWTQVEKQMRENGGEFSFAEFGTHLRNGPALFRKSINATVRHPLLAFSGSMALKTIPASRARLKKVMDQNARMIEIITRLQNGKVFLDGSKDPERLNQFLAHMGDKVKVVHLIRDARGVCNSYMRHYQVGMPVAAREWVKTDLACKRVMSRVPARNALMLKYEDLCAAPEAALASIFKLAGIGGAPTNRRSALSDFHILGNAMRLEFGKPIKLDEKWRASLGPADLATFEQMAGSMNRAYGYNQ